MATVVEEFVERLVAAVDAGYATLPNGEKRSLSEEEIKDVTVLSKYLSNWVSFLVSIDDADNPVFADMLLPVVQTAIRFGQLTQGNPIVARMLKEERSHQTARARKERARGSGILNEVAREFLPTDLKPTNLKQRSAVNAEINKRRAALKLSPLTDETIARELRKLRATEQSSG